MGTGWFTTAVTESPYLSAISSALRLVITDSIAVCADANGDVR